MELMYRTLHLLRNRYRFNGYIHVKAIPGAPAELIEKTGYLADRMSVNIELPSNDSLKRLAPQKTRVRAFLSASPFLPPASFCRHPDSW